MTTQSTRPDLYSRITNRIIESLEQGVRPWLKPWSGDTAGARITRPERHNGLPYRGINVLLLWSEALEKGFGSPRWLTYRQALALKANVRKGEHGSMVVYADRIAKKESDTAAAETQRQIYFLKAYTVFNAEQIEGLPDSYYTKPEPQGEPMQLIERAEQFFAATGASFSHGGNKAYYSPSEDRIQLPQPEAFRDAQSYEATKAHELTHWTRHETRLNRFFGRERWGDDGYAREELVAELGAAFLCADLSITPEPLEEHACYIASWLKVLREDKRAIVAAAAHAQRAVDYLHQLQPVQAVSIAA